MFKKVKTFGQLVKDISCYLYDGWKYGLLHSYFNSLMNLTRIHIGHLREALRHPKHVEEEKFVKLKATISGLHYLLPENPLYSYSILLRAIKPCPALFEKGLQSIMDQTSPHMEVLIGLEREPSTEIKKILNKYKETYAEKIKEFYIESPNDYSTLNHLAKEAKGNFLLLVDQEDWLRPDLTFRYEQALRLLSKPQQTVLYAYENRINQKGCFVPSVQDGIKPLTLSFPFFFEFFSHRGLLIPKRLWERCNGLREGYKGAEYEDLLLRLSLLDTDFRCVPFYLYSKRETPYPEHKSREALLKALKEYSHIGKLNWTWSEGYMAHTFRAIPQIQQKHSIQIVIPFKDQKTLTLKCIHSLIKQKDVDFKITAMDNRSQDRTIAEEIRHLGGEVLEVDQPFNYSRLNNLGCKNTRIASECDILLFLNNDIELDANALVEMLRWIGQPSIGMVGCRLHYPDGRLQHGGVIQDRRSGNMHWEHLEKGRLFYEMDQTKKLSLFPAVTTACAMIKRQTFLDIGGFDEMWYPIGYSDTNLAIKLQNRGLSCFYTPYAYGVHHESVSRKESLEDFEKSHWLHQLWLDQENRD